MARDSRGRSRVKAFLRWAGGKTRVVKHLLQCLPAEEFGEYWEPFLGSGALFFALAPARAHLSDSNPDLIACYQQVRDRPDLVFRYLKEHLSNTSEDYYYSVRAHYNTSRVRAQRTSAAQAARLIYLNRTSFNGIFRVNREGEYNVPYGFKEPPPAPGREQLRSASELLASATLSDAPYEKALAGDAPRYGDFVYLDPPYPPLTETANFTHYTPSRFSLQDHRQVCDVANELRSRGCFVMISNSAVEPIHDLYSGWHTRVLPVTRWVAADGSRRQVGDLVITSYPCGTNMRRAR